MPSIDWISQQRNWPWSTIISLGLSIRTVISLISRPLFCCCCSFLFSRNGWWVVLFASKQLFGSRVQRKLQPPKTQHIQFQWNFIRARQSVLACNYVLIILPKIHFPLLKSSRCVCAFEIVLCKKRTRNSLHSHSLDTQQLFSYSYIGRAKNLTNSRDRAYVWSCANRFSAASSFQCRVAPGRQHFCIFAVMSQYWL